jgi:hypothetical protein
MKMRKNRPIERNAVNATRTLFEACRCVFQEISQDNDYGKDAYVDLVEGDLVTSAFVALQIKGGDKYKRAGGYIIPIDGHASLWMQSIIPIAGIVHDADSGLLYWCDITQFLANHPTEVPSSIPVRKENVLNVDSLEVTFKPHFRSMAGERLAGLAVLRLCSAQGNALLSGLMDCFAFGRSDPRIFILIRYLLRMLDGAALKLGITILAHATPHPDIFWRKSNWVPESTCLQVKRHLQWSMEDIRRMLSDVEWSCWQRGDVGQDLYMILRQDPQIEEKMEKIAIEAMRDLDEDVAWAAFYLTVAWAKEAGPEKFDELIRAEPGFRDLAAR